MGKNEKPLAVFDNFVSHIILDKLKKVQGNINIIDESYSEDEIVNILEDANSLISFACGKDDALYEEWRYRFFVNDLGKRIILQVREIGVDPRDWSGKEDPET